MKEGLMSYAHCTNVGASEPVGEQDLGGAVDAYLLDHQPEESLRLQALSAVPK
jgi:hypothetical protein